jgi:hypothetical protein
MPRILQIDHSKEQGAKGEQLGVVRDSAVAEH